MKTFLYSLYRRSFHLQPKIIILMKTICTLTTYKKEIQCGLCRTVMSGKRPIVCAKINLSAIQAMYCYVAKRKVMSDKTRIIYGMAAIIAMTLHMKFISLKSTYDKPTTGNITARNHIMNLEATRDRIILCLNQC